MKFHRIPGEYAILPRILSVSFFAHSPIRLLLIVALAGCGMLNPASALAWGPEGHFQVGTIALQTVDEQAASRVWELLGTRDPSALGEACNWPDAVRETPEWEWSAPQHFVNIPRSASQYERERDCPDGLCVTESIKKYAGQLTMAGLSDEARWQAFAWLCHLVGDLHQPLHAGYLDDRGGNNIQISYQGEQDNLHQFWDRMVIRERFNDHQDPHRPNSDQSAFVAGNIWDPAETNGWTSESHALVEQTCYPPDEVIQSDFADRSWLLIQEQWLKAGKRLARILNATLGTGEVVLDRDP